jgi:hypothetical protein
MARVDIVAVVLVVVVVFLIVVVVVGLFIWAAVHDGQEDKALRASRSPSPDAAGALGHRANTVNPRSNDFGGRGVAQPLNGCRLTDRCESPRSTGAAGRACSSSSPIGRFS